MALDLSTLDPESIPDMAATAFDEADRDFLIPEFQAPEMKTSFKDLGLLALPISARLPKPMGSRVVAGLNAMTMAMRAIKKGKVREALAKSREADRELAKVESALRQTAGRYGKIMRSQTNPEIANLDFRTEAAQGLDQQLLDMLKGGGATGQSGRAVTDRMNEFDKFAQQMQLKREQHKLNVIKTMLDAYKLLKPVQTDDLVNLDQINRERSLSGLAPMKLEEYMQMKATLKPETSPSSLKEFQAAQEDPAYAQFLEARGAKEAKSPTAIQEYEYAKQNGYTGSFMDFKKETSGKRSFRDIFDSMAEEKGGGEPAPKGMQPKQSAPPAPTQAPKPTGGGMSPDRIESIIRKQLNEAQTDPKKVWGDLQQKYEQTGDELYNPSKYLNLFPGSTFTNTLQ